MVESRETFFECSSTVEGECRTGVVRAWNAEEARAAFREMLAVEGVTEPGAVIVRRPRRDAKRLRARSFP